MYSYDVGETQEDLESVSIFSLFPFYFHVTNLIFCLKIYKFVQIHPHVWEHLDMAGEHLDIIRINNKNPEN